MNAARLLSLLLIAPTPLMASCDLLSDPKELLTFNVDTTIEVPGALPIIYPSTQQIADLPVNANGEREFQLPAVYFPVPLPSEVSNGLIERVEINTVTLTIANNTLDVPIEPIELRVGGPGTTYESADTAAISVTLPPGFNGASEAEIAEQNRTRIGTIIAGADFSMGMTTSFVIPAGAPPAGGSADARFTLGLRFVVSPL